MQLALGWDAAGAGEVKRTVCGGEKAQCNLAWEEVTVCKATRHSCLV